MDYPVLQAADIFRHCKQSLGMAFVTEEGVLRPTAESIRPILAGFLELVYNQSVQESDSADFHEASAPIVLLFRKVQTLVSRLACRDTFRLSDLLAPDPKRTRRFFSALINFVKFKTDEELFSEHMAGQQVVGVSQQEFRKLKDEFAEVQSEVERLRGKIEAQRSTVQQKQEAIAALHCAKTAAEKTWQTLSADIDALGKQCEETEDGAARAKKTAAESEEKRARLQQLITNPESVQFALAQAHERLEAEKRQHLKLELRWKELSRRVELASDCLLQLKGAKSVLETLGFARREAKDLSRKIAQAEESRESLRGVVELAQMKVVAAQRSLGSATQQTARDKEASDNKLQNLIGAQKTKAEELAVQRCTVQEREAAVQKAQGDLASCELRTKSQADLYAQKLQRCRATLLTLSKALDPYLASLQTLKQL